MPIKAAELQVVIGADTNPAVQGIHSAMGVIGQAASTALGVFSGMLLTKAVGALGGLASAGIQAVGEFERISATLGTLVKRDLANTGQSLDLVGEKTQELLTWVQRLAKESPFDASGVTTALRTAMAYGFTAEQAQRLTKATIDYAAGSGQSADVMNQVALALGQIQAKGKLAGQEMLQLVNAGIDVRAALAKSLGITTKEVAKRLEKGTIDANTAIEAVVSTLEKDFGGAAKEQSQTVSGLLSTFGEIKQMGLRELFSGLVDAVRPLAATFLDWLQGEGIAKLHEIGSTIGGLISHVVNAAMAFADAGLFSIEFSEALGGISPKLQEIWTWLSPLVENAFKWIQDHGELVRAALMGIAVALGAMLVISAVAGLISALVNPLTLVMVVAGLLSAAWASNWGGIRDKTKAVVNFLRPYIQGFIAGIQQWWQAHGAAIIAAAKNIWDRVVAGFRGFVGLFKAIFSAYRLGFQGDWYGFGVKLREIWDKLWERIKEIVKNAIASIRTKFSEVDWKAVGRSIIDGIVNGVKAAVSSLIEAAKSAARAALDATRGFLKGHSPSRLFATQVGEPMIQGWVEGIKQAIPQLKSASQLAGKAAADTAKRTLGLQSSMNIGLQGGAQLLSGLRQFMLSPIPASTAAGVVVEGDTYVSITNTDEGAAAMTMAMLMNSRLRRIAGSME